MSAVEGMTCTARLFSRDQRKTLYSMLCQSTKFESDQLIRYCASLRFSTICSRPSVPPPVYHFIIIIIIIIIFIILRRQKCIDCVRTAAVHFADEVQDVLKDELTVPENGSVLLFLSHGENSIEIAGLLTAPSPFQAHSQMSS